jgi:hypothetical protein
MFAFFSVVGGSLDAPRSVAGRVPPVNRLQ